ncbi:alpha/beta hydrolase [Winogradskyella immobilis]|uniref:Alpha/beta hydrolase n=1 Tax=Winogradskyella immobilis TaxID=2816852 RepID=A0ABS8EL82_9FLAO|nr:alpha/beta hydrolase [Winogradskyella immobilis]MCC1483686.1 alpha/beta hydrolase [Winogradskyella immobilis]MCG0015780.1 alpha/beta hydrolase [Winogradskyella immobilis]
MSYIKSIRILFSVVFITTLLSFSCKPENKTIETVEVVSNLTKPERIKHTVDSEGHPMALWEKKANNPKGIVLFIHGRTWSGVPDFDLQVEGEDLSLMDGVIEQGYTTYALDLRGYGGTPRDSTEWNTPEKASNDILNVMKWISAQNGNQKVHLFGWSNGSTLSLLAAQKNSEHMASLTLFGFWLDLDYTFQESPKDIQLKKLKTTAESAASDFIISGSISQNAIDTYVKMALESDPIKVDWKDEVIYNTLSPEQIEIPVLILQGEFDPIAPTDRQAKLFTRLKTGDKSWIVISGGDHAAFMETPRPHFINSFTGFINRFNP